MRRAGRALPSWESIDTGHAQAPMLSHLIAMSHRIEHPVRRPAIIGGGSTAVSKETAIELAARGYPVAVGARRADLLDDLVDRIRGDGGEAVCFELDVTDQESVDRFVAQASDAIGDIEILVTGAEDIRQGRVHEISADPFEDQVQIHLIGAHRMASAVLPAMVSRRRGDVVFLGHDVAIRQRVYMAAYGAAQAGLAAVVMNLRAELQGTGVRASMVNFGQASTATGSRTSAEASGDLTRHSSCLRAGDIARAVAFVIETPRGSNVVSVELQAEAPVA